MPRNPHKKRCAKSNCRNYAMRDRHLCRVHLNSLPTRREAPSLGEAPSPGKGPAPGKPNTLNHGFYSCHYTLQEVDVLLDLAEVPGLEDEITAARIAIRRLLAYLEQDGRIPDRDFQAAIALIFTGTSTIGRLLRHQQVLSGEAADTISGGIATILNQLTDETGYDL